MTHRLSSGDLATLSLLDPDQGVCPDGHRCTFDAQPGYRACGTCDYRGMALICWDITPAEMHAAERADAASGVVVWARSFLANRT